MLKELVAFLNFLPSKGMPMAMPILKSVYSGNLIKYLEIYKSNLEK